MGKATYWQRGETLDYINTGTVVIEANTVITFGGRIGIAGTDILPGETGSLHVTGVFEMPKTAEGAVGMGTDVYFDGNGITDTKGTGTVMAGYAAQPAAAADTVILVKLAG